MAALLTSACSVFPASGIVRCISSSASRSGRGIRGVVKALGLREKELQDLGSEELEAMAEPSLDTFNQEAANIEFDTKRFQDHLRQKTVEHKYFKPWGPQEENMLTWSMKEQVKYLHSSDPEQWTPDVLSKSFPISPEGVVRLLKSRWIPSSDKERQRHDQAVITRWKKHMKGQLGSLRILEKALNDKFIPESLPSPVNGMTQILNDLRFDEEQSYVPKRPKKKKKFPEQHKMKGRSFHSIIEDYEIQTSTRKKEAQDSSSLATISGPPQYKGLYTKVTGDDAVLRKMKVYKKEGEFLTFREFMKKKKGAE